MWTEINVPITNTKIPLLKVMYHAQPTPLAISVTKILFIM